MALRRFVLGVALLFVPATAIPAWTNPPQVLELKVERTGSTTYFYVRLGNPSDLIVREPASALPWQLEQWEPSRLPHLVPQDDRTRAVYLNWIDQLEFYGKATDNATAKLLLVYPTNCAATNPWGKMPLAERLNQKGTWAEVPLTLDFSQATRLDGKPPVLERKWARQQARFFAKLETQTPEFGFYGFARELTAQKYAVTPWEGAGGDKRRDAAADLRRLYEVTTGAAAITESLALDRMRKFNSRDKDETPTTDIDSQGAYTIYRIPWWTKVADLPGIDIAEHPWEKMMAGQKPTAEPLAQLVPHDNYYVHFKNIVKFLETGDLIDQWGSTLSRALEIHSRDYQVKERLERQLCIKSSKMTRLLGPAVVKGLALTGSDPYVREGTDFTVIFHVANKNLFLFAVNPYLKEAKTLFGDKLQEEKQNYRDITIESYVTPLREVSLHRAMFADYIVYSNSPVGIRRVIDTYKGKHKALADSLDFQYMRTVFRLEDPAEDGFAFLPDAFIRNLVGPATRIKERRRLEAMTSMSMINNGALFTAWETGKLPAHHDHLLAYTGLKPEQLFSGDGAPVLWNADYQAAVSSTYNTLNFATPLIELPIDKVTPSERREYREFRDSYLNLWRRYFDPIGIRIGINDKEVRWETYILPLVNVPQYNDLRTYTGGGTIELDPRKINEKAVAHVLVRISQWREKDSPNWLSLRFDDSPMYGKILERWIESQIVPIRVRQDIDWEVRSLFQVPMTLGGLSKGELEGVQSLIKNDIARQFALPKIWTSSKVDYQGVSIEQFKATLDPDRDPKTEPPALYSAGIEGVYYLSTTRQGICDEIDGAEARAKDKGKAETVPINTSIYVSPKVGVQLKEFLRFYLELETHRRALDNANLLYPLYRGGVISADADADTVQVAAMKYLGCVPVSPDYSPYYFDSRIGEVVNKRHGSLRLPQLHSAIEPDAPVARMLDQFGFLRADLRFREDGIHTTVTLRKK